MPRKKTAKVEEELVTASVRIANKVFTAQGETPYKAIENLNVGASRGMGVLSLTKNGVTQTRILPIGRTAKLFSMSRLMREVGLKQVSSLFAF